MKRFKNKIALITGAGSGIGRATAIRLANEGAQLLLADLNPQGLAASAEQLPDHSDFELMRLDVSEAEACHQAVAKTVDRFGGLDVLCNIAGISSCQHLADIEEQHWQQVINVNLNSVLFLSQAAMPHLLQRRGNIVNMASTAALNGLAYNAAYCASKGAVVALSKSMAIEFASQGVRINAICPGAVATPLSRNFTMPKGADPALLERMQSLLDISQPSEIAAAVAYLASDEARFVTGTVFAIDGGQTAG